jgi:hypothetical protein
MIKRILLALLFIYLLSIGVHAQNALCVIAGTGDPVRNPDNTLAVGVVFTISNLQLNGALVTPGGGANVGGFTAVYTTDSSGIIRDVHNNPGITLPQGATAYLYSLIRPWNVGTKGVQITVPNTSTATLESLAATSSVPVQGLTIENTGTALPTLIGAINLANGITATQTAPGIAEIQLSTSGTISFGGINTDLQDGVELKPWGTSAGDTGEIHFDELVANGSNYVGWKAPDSISANVIWKLPAADGTGPLFSNGGGVTSFRAIATGDLPTGIPIGDLAADSITIQGTAVPLGGTTLGTNAVVQFGQIGIGGIPVGLLDLAGTQTASGGFARAFRFTATLDAAANNDTLAGIFGNTTFVPGAFTGVTDYLIRLQNASNDKFKVDGAGDIIGAGYDSLAEVSAPTGASGIDFLWGDSTAHRLKVNSNNGGAAQLVISGGDINTSDQVISLHLSSPLGVTQGGTGDATFTANTPLIGNGTGPIGQGTVSGNTTEFGTVSGSVTATHWAVWDSFGNLIDGGPVSGGGGTITSGTSGQMAAYNGTTSIASTPGFTYNSTNQSEAFTGAAVAGGANLITFTPGAHTGVTSEIQDYTFASHTITITAPIATQRFATFQISTITASSAETVTTAATLTVNGAPAAAGSAVITNPYAVWIKDGALALGPDTGLNNGGTEDDYFIYEPYATNAPWINSQVTISDANARYVGFTINGDYSQTLTSTNSRFPALFSTNSGTSTLPIAAGKKGIFSGYEGQMDTAQNIGDASEEPHILGTTMIGSGTMGYRSYANTITVNPGTYTLTLGSITSFTFSVQINGGSVHTTSSITASGLTATSLQSSIAALTGVGSANVSVSGSTGGPFTINFNVGLVTSNVTATITPTGGSGSSIVASSSHGQNIASNINLNTPSDGSSFNFYAISSGSQALDAAFRAGGTGSFTNGLDLSTATILTDEIKGVGFTVDSSGDLASRHVGGSGGTPSIAAGAGAGTSPTVSVSGTDTGMLITITTGSSPSTASTIVTITFANAFTTTPTGISLTPVNVNAVSLTGTTAVDAGSANWSSTGFTLTSNTSALAASTIYKWSVVVIGK